MNFILIKDQRINLNNVVQYYTKNIKRDGGYYELEYYIAFDTVSDGTISIFFTTEKERNDTLQELDKYTEV
jgi:hypothetical protein